MSSAIYYADSSSLSLASSIYLDANLTTLAPNGYYSDQSISRYQQNGVLLPAEGCANCENPQGTTLTFTSYEGGVSPNSKFTFFLSNILPIDTLTISSASIDAYEEINCNSINSSANDSMAENAVIAAGSNMATAKGFGLNCSNPSAPVSKYRRGVSFQVNGTTVNDGNTIIIGGVPILIVINSSCSDLSCNS